MSPEELSVSKKSIQGVTSSKAGDRLTHGYSDELFRLLNVNPVLVGRLLLCQDIDLPKRYSLALTISRRRLFPCLDFALTNFSLVNYSFVAVGSCGSFTSSSNFKSNLSAAFRSTKFSEAEFIQ